jgi:hypothetical protein
MKVGDLVKLREEWINVDESYSEVENASNLRGLVIEANCHPYEPKDDEDVLVMWNRPTWTGVKGEYSSTVNHDIAEVEVVANESG